MIHSIGSKLCLTAAAADSTLQHAVRIKVPCDCGAEPIFRGGVFKSESFIKRTAEMAYPKKEKLSTEAAIVIVGVALALFVGVFLFVSNQYIGTQEAQVAQHDTTPTPQGNELPIAPLTPPESPAMN